MATTPVWTELGPKMITGGSNIPKQENPTYGAVECVLPHPTKTNVLYIGAVNGGVWKTTEALLSNPTWTNINGNLPSLSVGALVADASNADTIYVGFAKVSSAVMAGPYSGLYRCAGDGQWSAVPGNEMLVGQQIRGLYVDGDTILVGTAGGGIFRSSDGGASFSFNEALGNRDITDLIKIPEKDQYYAVANGYHGHPAGLFYSTDGQTWTNVSDNDTNLKALFAGMPYQGQQQVVIAGANTGAVWLFAVNKNSRWGGLWRTKDQGANWEEFTQPPPAYDTNTGATHLALGVDPNNENVCFMAASFVPVYRVDVSGGSPAYTDIASTTQPHADGRTLLMQNSPTALLYSSDGGLYRCLQPLNAAEWTSVSGDATNGIIVTEMYQVAYDPYGKVVEAATQDNGTIMQTAAGSALFETIAGGDGDFAAIGVNANNSFRYSAESTMLNLSFRKYDTSGNQLDKQEIPLMMSYGNQFICPLREFDTMYNLTYDNLLFEVNKANAQRFVFPSFTGVVYEVQIFDFNIANVLATGGTVAADKSIQYPKGYQPDLSFPGYVSALAYGGFQGTVPCETVMAIGSENQVWYRGSDQPIGDTPVMDTAFNAVAGNGDFTVVEIVLADNAATDMYVLTSESRVYSNTGDNQTWIDLSDNLPGMLTGINRHMAFVRNSNTNSRALFVSANNTVCFATCTEGGDWTSWHTFKGNLPNAVLDQIRYDPVDDVLVLATIGRGAWLLENVSSFLP